MNKLSLQECTDEDCVVLGSDDTDKGKETSITCGYVFLETFSPYYKQAYDFLIAIADPISRSNLFQFSLLDYSSQSFTLCLPPSLSVCLCFG